MAFELNITVLYKTDYADVMNIAQLKLFAAISAILICCIGCTSNTQDPLVGWKELGSVGWNGFEVEGERLPALSKSITDDLRTLLKSCQYTKNIQIAVKATGSTEFGFLKMVLEAAQ